MRTPLKTLLVLAVLAVSSAFAATVWKWVDKNGVTHYSDQPVPGAIRVDLNVQTYESDEATLPPSASATPTKKTTAALAYQKIEISNPANEQTFSGTAGQVSVAVSVEPGVQQGHSVRLLLDGQSVSEPNSSATSFVLKDVSRGAHTLSASVVASDGQSLIQSASITFFMQQPSVLQKN